MSDLGPQLRSLLPPYSAVCFLFLLPSFLFSCFNTANEILLFYMNITAFHQVSVLSLVYQIIKISQQMICSLLY